ncbi:zinc finger protein [Macleaya cordata]|uniref:Zinc finger protein n=1 Tax=Macleaya cordata TaxID=56857 RepID=A0A200R308_MACCD|nr:zinc finger protein [Macleaya cordata]
MVVCKCRKVTPSRFLEISFSIRSAFDFRRPSSTVLFTRSLFVGNAFVSQSIKYACTGKSTQLGKIEWKTYIHSGLIDFSRRGHSGKEIVLMMNYVRTYSEWVIDGEYDWPPTCCLCQAVLGDGTDSQTTRLGCLHVMHTNCLVSHIKGFPPHTAPAGYVCPTCSTSIWPPKSIKDSGSRLHSKLKEAIMQTGMEKNLFGNHPVSLPTAMSRGPPPAFASDPLMHVSAMGGRDKSNVDSLDSIEDRSSLSAVAKEGKHLAEGYAPATGIGSSKLSATDIVEIDDPSSAGNQFITEHEPNVLKSASPAGPVATTRKGAFQVERQNSEISYYADDEDGNRKKYSRRGPLRHKFLRALLPFWSSALPTLPVTAPPRKDASNLDEIPEGRVRHQKSSRMDPRKILLIMAIMACMATMGILYYRLAQRSLGEDGGIDDDQQ